MFNNIFNKAINKVLDVITTQPAKTNEQQAQAQVGKKKVYGSEWNLHRAFNHYFSTRILKPGEQTAVDALKQYEGKLLPAKYIDKFRYAKGTNEVGFINGLDVSSGSATVMDWLTLTMHSLLVAPSGAGKTFGFITPLALSAATVPDMSCFVVDVKGDDFYDRLGVQAKMFVEKLGGRFFYFQPDDLNNPRRPSLRWNFMHEIRASSDADLVAQILVMSSSVAAGGGSSAFFVGASQNVLSGIIQCVKAVKGLKAVPFDIYNFVADEDFRKDMIASLPTKVSPTDKNIIMQNLKELIKPSGKFSLDPTLLIILKFLESEHIRDATSASDFTLADIHTKKGFLILGKPKKNLDPAASNVIISIMSMLLVRQLSQREDSATPQLLLILDEFVQIPGFSKDPDPADPSKRPGISIVLETLRSKNVCAILATQDIDQITAASDKVKSAILGNTLSKFIMSGVSPATAETFQEIFSDFRRTYVSQTLSNTESKGTSFSLSNMTPSLSNTGGISAGTSRQEKLEMLFDLSDLQQIPDRTLLSFHGKESFYRPFLVSTAQRKFEVSDAQAIVQMVNKMSNKTGK